MDKRIGVKAKDGAVVSWPELSISGLPYTRPCTMIGLGGNHFCVVDLFPQRGYLEEVDKLKKQVGAMSDAPKRVSAKS